jgi:hypothetical protein
MATRAVLAMRNEDNTYSGVYLHWGELKSVWDRLPVSVDEVRQLIAGGNIERLLHHDAVRCTSSKDDPYDVAAYDSHVATAATITELVDAVNMAHIEHVLLFEGGTWLVVRYLEDVRLESFE